MKVKLDSLLIRHWMLDNGLNNTSLSCKIGVSDSLISSWFSGNRMPRIPELIKLARMMKLAVEDLLIIEED